MNARRFRCVSLASVALFAFAGGCGSSGDSPARDAAPDLTKTSPDTPVVPTDGPSPADAIGNPESGLPRSDAASPDAAPDLPTTGAEVTSPLLDAAPTESGAMGLDAPAGETGATDLGAARVDGGTTGADVGIVNADGPQDAAPDGFVPGPATAIVVNSSNTATYNLGDGTWKVFYFDATAGQLYCVSELSGIVRGFVSTSASVSPSNYLYATDGTTGALSFIAATAQRYYVAVAVNGGGSSGSFQVADGGQLLALGANSVTLSAPSADNYYYFRFPIGAGHGYSISVAGTSTTSVGVAVSPRAERSSNGQLQAALWGISGPLPLTNEAIPATSVALSYSGYYYFFVRVSTAMSITVTLTQTS